MSSSFLYIGISIIFLIIILQKVKKKRFFEKESFFWIIGSIVGLILAVCPDIIIILSNFVGIDYAPSLLFLMAIIFVLYLLFRLTEQVSLLREQVKDLGQRLVVLEKDIEENKKEDNTR